MSVFMASFGQATLIYCRERGLATTSATTYRKAAIRLEKQHGGPLPLAELTCGLVYDAAKSFASPHSAKSFCSTIGAVWRWCREEYPLECPRCRLKSWRTPELRVEVWSVDDVRRLVAACSIAFVNTSGFRSVWPWPREAYWRTLIAAAWSTGLSQIDLLSLHRKTIGDGTWYQTRHKTGKGVTCCISPSVLREIDKHGITGIIWAHPATEEGWRGQFRRIVEEAGLTGTFKKLRKSAGTHAEKMVPGCGHMFLAHSRKTFESNYYAAPNEPVVRLPEVA